MVYNKEDLVWCDMLRPLYPELENKRLLDQRQLLQWLHEAITEGSTRMHDSKGMQIYLEYLTWWNLQRDI